MTVKDPEPNAAPAVLNKSANPPGVLPRHAQAGVVAGISVVMVIVILLSSRNEPKRNTTVQPPVPTPTDPNQDRIKEYQRRIEEQTRKLDAEQAKLLETKQALGLAATSSNPPTGSARPASHYIPSIPTQPSYGGYPPSAPERDSIRADKQKRDYESLFASNVVQHFGPETKPVDTDPPPASANRFRASRSIMAADPSPPSARPRETADQAASNAPVSAKGPEESAEQLSPLPRARKRDADLNRSEGKLYRIFEGTVLETVLKNRLDGAFSGPVSCMVTTDLYSHDRQRLLIPQGSVLLGEVQRVETSGQQRLAVTFHRLIMPDGYSESLDKFQGLNQLGETGLRDQVNHHYLQVFGVSIAIGAIAGLSQANTGYGFETSAADAYRQGVASSLSQSSLRILERFLNVLPTFTVREGHRVKVYLSEDLLLPAYEKHQMPGDL